MGAKTWKLYWRNWVWRCWLDSSGLGQGTVASFCKHDTKQTGSLRLGDFFIVSAIISLSTWTLSRADN